MKKKVIGENKFYFNQPFLLKAEFYAVQFFKIIYYYYHVINSPLQFVHIN